MGNFSSINFRSDIGSFSFIKFWPASFVSPVSSIGNFSFINFLSINFSSINFSFFNFLSINFSSIIFIYFIYFMFFSSSFLLLIMIIYLLVTLILALTLDEQGNHIKFKILFSVVEYYLLFSSPDVY